MSEHGNGPPPPADQTGAPAAHIDEVCDKFEQARRAGRPVMIEEYLLRAPDGERDRLLAELLEIELDLSQRAGTFVDAEDYRVRFPDRAELVDSVFRRVVKTRRLGDYELLDELGRGGMGVVYRAQQVFLNQTVAVKILPRRYLDDSQAVSRFFREMQSIGALSHPNIVRAYNAGNAGGVHFLAMEYIDGVSLQRYVDIGPPGHPLAGRGPLGVGAACEIIRQASLGLQHAHEHQLVHRDMKPANLMLSREGQVKILDLGLAKLRVQCDDGDPTAASLTQPGATMGTVDYMAPEQWENSAGADIRADVYSLGCTLFFLLTGKPPYGEPAFDSSRKKLMAHAVAAIPPLRDHCADVPEELEEVYERMVAKKPEDRYSSPAEVAEAVADFADAEELAEVVAALPPQDVCVAAANTGVHGPGEITPPRHELGSAGSPPPSRQLVTSSARPRRHPQSRWANRQKIRRNVTIGVAAGLTIICGLLASTVLRHRADESRGDLSTGRAPSRSDGRRNAERPPGHPAAGRGATSAAPSREALAADVALLPGLNGRWWFDEMPWLTPFLRQAIAEKLLDSADLNSVAGDRPQGYLMANTGKARQWLWEVGQRCCDKLSPCQQTLTDQLKALADNGSGSEGRVAASLQHAVQQFTDAHKDGKWSAVDLHTVAVLQHAIEARQGTPLRVSEDGGVTSLASRASMAKESYDKALKAYRQPHKARDFVEPLCLADSAIFAEDVLDDFKDARQRLDAALGEKDLPVLFHVSMLVQRGRLAAEAVGNPGEFEDYRFIYAKKLLDGCKDVKPVHPLAAYIAENYAASLLDQWKVEEAAKQFQAAYHIRLIYQKENGPSAAIDVFRDRLGLAVANRFRGNIDTARRSCKALAGDIRAAIQQAERGRDKPVASDLGGLRDQLANTLEAWGDCELYGGAAGNGKVNLAQAAINYEQAGKTAANPASVTALGYKLGIVQALSGAPAASSGTPAGGGADIGPRPGITAERDEYVQSGAGRQRAVLLRQLAGAVISIRGPAPPDGSNMLRSFLEQFKLSPSPRGPDRREIVEMQLLAAELLLSSDLTVAVKTAHQDLKYLGVPLAAFQGRREVRPYLRRYYELAVEICDKADAGKTDPGQMDLVQIAHYVLDSRLARPHAPAGTPATLVLFSFAHQTDLAVFLPQDGRPGRRFELGLTRNQIKAARGRPLHLNDDLVSMIKAEIAERRSVEVFWDDTPAWPDEDPEALTDNDWPFGGQIDLAKLRAPFSGQNGGKGS